MKLLIVDDEFTNRLLLQEITKEFASSQLAVDGDEAVEAVQHSLNANDPYDAILLDIMMPKMNGHDALKKIREIEESNGYSVGQGTKIIMVTALGDKKNVIDAFKEEADGYLVKPVEKEKLVKQLKKLDLL
ncbi:MAG: response regulator [Deltaproteobacteria bacterium]|nr:response regulator [Deltaproteobacteria bacterium]MBN2673554.1 response regulator [Deltaproteobacteria bacterium]